MNDFMLAILRVVVFGVGHSDPDLTATGAGANEAGTGLVVF